MSTTTIAAVAAPFGRDVEQCFERIARYVDLARLRNADLLVLPEAAIGGYLQALPPGRYPGKHGRAPLLAPDGPELRRLAALAGDMIVCAGYAEGDGRYRYNSAVCVNGDGVLGHHRKVHQPLGEGDAYDAGREFSAFDTPIGRLGMMICYDKAFPEAGRSLALDGAEIIACLSAWPMSRTHPADNIAEDRWRYRFDLFDQVRALENQVVWVSANQTGTFGSLHFVGNSKILHPDGSVLAATGTTDGLAIAEIDVGQAIATARRAMHHIRDRRPESYSQRCLLAGEPFGPRWQAGGPLAVPLMR
jgi:predicted amidohydrolase